MNEPDLRVISGNPTPEEIAAVVTVLRARAATPAELAPKTTPSRWSAYARTVRASIHPGPGAWRNTGRS